MLSSLMGTNYKLFGSRSRDDRSLRLPSLEVIFIEKIKIIIPVSFDFYKDFLYTILSRYVIGFLHFNVTYLIFKCMYKLRVGLSNRLLTNAIYANKW